MTETICIFEDAGYARLLPLVYIRPVYNLRCGILSLKEKIFHAYPGAKFALHCRSYLADSMQLRNPGVPVNDVPDGSCLFLNGRVVAGRKFVKQIPWKGERDVAYVQGDDLVAARVSGKGLKRVRSGMGNLFSLELFEGLPRVKVEVPMISYPWDVIHRNGVELANDFALLAGKKRRAAVAPRGVHMINKGNVHIGVGTRIHPGAVLIAEDGPISLGRNVRILPQATIFGPAYIGDGSIVKTGAQIYGSTSIGPVCKVGGEIEHSVIHGFSNKQHHGFLGHSYIGAWVNMGAGTTNSDLKSNYGSVRVSLGGEPIDTGQQFIGLIFGDHSKTAINSMFNAGTVVGISSNIFGDGFPPKYVPSFSWGAAGETFTTFGIDRAIEVARRVMARRNVQLTASEEKLFQKLFELTSDERQKRGMPD